MVAHALLGIFVMGCLVHVYLMDSYVIRCPEQAEWNIRAEIRCQNATKYFCLYNDIDYSYQEGCTGPDWDRPGSKRIYSRNFNRAPCNDTRYQPIKFVTNGNSDCIFRKSLCTEEGQTLFEAGTTRTDSTCRCDYKQGYAFVTVPRNKCSCRPSEEDCSCYLKKCQDIGYYLSADYECTKNGTKKTVCPLMSENLSEDPHIDMALTGTPREYDSYPIKRTYDVAILVSICLVVMIVITMYIMFQQRLPRCTCLSTEQVSTVITMLRQRLPRCPCLSTEQNINKLKETVWGNNEHDQDALSEGDKLWNSALDEFKDTIEKEGLDTVLKHLNDDLDNRRNEPVKLAVTGKFGVGKSSFINAIRNLKPGDPGFATTSSYGNTTKHTTVYEYPGNPTITLHDLPAFGTIELPTHEYEKTVELHQYDYILIFIGNIEDNDIEIAKKLKEMKKPFCFVRSKIDLDILNAKNDSKSDIDIVKKIISIFPDNIKHAEFNNARHFVISNHNPRIYQFNYLVSYIQSNLPALKCDAVMFPLFGELTDDIIDNKYQLLKVSLASVCLAKAPVSNVDRMCSVVLICKALLSYHKAFAFGQQSVKEIFKDDYVRQKLNANSIIEIQAADEAMGKFIIIELEKLKTPESLYVCSNEPVVSIGPICEVSFRLLNQILDNCRDDAKVVYSHLMNVNA